MKHYLPDYFDESKLSKQDKDLLQNEKALQKMQSQNRMAGYRLLNDKCVQSWHKYLDTPKMQAGRKLSERQYNNCLANLVKMGLAKVDPVYHVVYKVK